MRGVLEVAFGPYSMKNENVKNIFFPQTSKYRI